MASLNFPANPTLGQIYVAPSGVNYQWNGTTWITYATAQLSLGPTGPTGATGPGLPTGGASGQVLGKTGPGNYEWAWIDGVAPVTGQAGAFQFNNNGVLASATGFTFIAGATNSVILGPSTNSVVGQAALSQGLSTKAIGNYSHAEGEETTANGSATHAEGYLTMAFAPYSHAEGSQATAVGQGSHAEGRQTTAKGIYSHTEGNNTVSNALYQTVVGQFNTESNIEGAFIIGGGTSAAQRGNIAVFATGAVQLSRPLYINGVQVIAGGTPGPTGPTGPSATTPVGSVGMLQYKASNTTFGGMTGFFYDPTVRSLAIGTYTGSGVFAQGLDSFALGTECLTSGENAVAMGQFNMAEADFSMSVGRATNAKAQASFTQGESTKTYGVGSHAEGENTTADGDYAHAEGTGTISGGYASHSEGFQTFATGAYSHAEGETTTSLGTASHSEGSSTRSFGTYSHSEGESTTAKGQASHTEGNNTLAEGTYSHAEGILTRALGTYSHSEGISTTAVSPASHAEGWLTTAKHDWAHAEGVGTITGVTGQTVVGKYNTETAAAFFVIGGGTGASQRGNIATFGPTGIALNRSVTVNGLPIGGVAGSNKQVQFNDNSVARGATGIIYDGATNSVILATSSFGSVSNGNVIMCGFGNSALGYASIAEGASCTATNTAEQAHAEGDSTTVKSIATHAGGVGTIAGGQFQWTIGAYNVENATANFNTGWRPFIVGIGSSDTNRRNGFEVVAISRTAGAETGTIVLAAATGLNFASDVAAAAGNVPVGGLYHNSGAVRIRLS